MVVWITWFMMCSSSRIQKERVSKTGSAAIRRGKAGEGPYEVSPTDRAVLNRWSTHVR